MEELDEATQVVPDSRCRLPGDLHSHSALCELTIKVEAEVRAQSVPTIENCAFQLSISLVNLHTA
jgi:hypothetical protein